MEKIPSFTCRFFRPGPNGIDHLRGLPDHNTIKQQLTDLHAECCTHPTSSIQHLPDLISDEDLDKLIEQLLRNIFKNRTIAHAPQKLKLYFIEQLSDALITGYGTTLDEIDFDTPNYKMLEALQQDIVKFSAAKNDVMNKAIARELIGPDGLLREWKDFKIAALQITDDHTDKFLKAEYNLAIVSAQSAAKWVQIEEDAEDLPILEFDAVMDGHTTEICRNFNGVRLPITDKFWDLYYIPNHYGERSTIRQDVDNGKISDTGSIIYPDKIPLIFQVNLAKNKLVFPAGHPYYGGKHG